MATVAPMQQPAKLTRSPIIKKKEPIAVKFFESGIIKAVGFLLWAVLIGLKIYHSVQEGRGEELAKWAGITKSVLVPVVYTLLGGGIVLSTTQSTLRRFVIGAFILFIVSIRMYTNIKEGRGEDPPKWVSAFSGSFNFVLLIALVVFGFFLAKGQNRVRILLIGILLAMDTGFDIVKMLSPPESEPSE